MRRIAIIGGGASGTLLATNLLRHPVNERTEINLVEKRPNVGGGVAFSTAEELHLLNVPAGKMGAFVDEVDHFHRWLTEKGHAYEQSAFVPRRYFGEYLRECLLDAYDRSSDQVVLNILDDEAVDIELDPGKAQLILAGGDILYSEAVVLAFGNFLPPHPDVPDLQFTRSERYIRAPWKPNGLDEIGKEDRVLIIGTGLSMVDVAIQLNGRGHLGEINALSTRGLLPEVHKLWFTYAPFHDEVLGLRRVTDLLKTVRRHVAIAESDSSDWRAVIDVLRPITQDLWLGLPAAEKRYFMQHLSRYWNVARHRMPPEAAEKIDELRGTGQLNILKGRLKSISRVAGQFEVRYSDRSVVHELEADVIVNCIGSESRFHRLDSPLVQNLIAAGKIRPDELSLGLDATPDGRLINSNGEPSELLYCLGTALKGILWESTAIPEIRAQAKLLAATLLDKGGRS